MYNITIISTFHSEIGKCNSIELYKIIESKNPEVIFEEMPLKLFDIVYNGNLNSLPSDAPLELKCIKNYIQNHNVKNYPVDIESRPYLSPNEMKMFNIFDKNEKYKILKKEFYSTLTEEGFKYLNSDQYLDFYKRKKSLEKDILELEKQNDSLINTYTKFDRQIDTREYGMIENIYHYSKENRYNRAVFLLGSGHRESIMKKIAECKIKSKIKINWKIYNGE